jgi:Mrp family chromosome partitioning ATPase
VEPINYRRALRRRWPLIVVLAIVGAVAGVLVPIHSPYPPPKSQWQAQALAGVPPKGQGITLTQVEFYAEQEPVYNQVASAMKLKKNQAYGLRRNIQIRTKKSLPTGSTYVYAKQPTKSGAAKLANEFVKQLGIYMNAQLNAQYQKDLSNTQASVNSLSNELATLQTAINNLTKSSNSKKSSSTTTTTSSSTTTTSTSSTTTSTTKPPTTTTTAARTTTTTAKMGPISTTTAPPKTTSSSSTSTTAATTPTTVPSTTPTTEPATSAYLASAISKKSPTTTGKKSTATTARKVATTTTLPNTLPALQQKFNTVKAEYGAALSKLTKLQSAGPEAANFNLLQPARTGNEKFFPVKSNPFARRTVRAAVGFLAGLILGLIIAIGLDALDKRLRTAPRTTVVFGLPVIAEIPKEIAPGGQTSGRQRETTGGGRGRGRGRDVDQPAAVAASPIAAAPIAVFDWPASVVAEAYRRLRVAVMFSPAAKTNGAAPTPQTDGYAAGGFRSDAVRGAAPEVQKAENGQTNGTSVHSNGAEIKRDVVMVTCPSTEPTNSKVVNNLAAAYAEAGERVLIVSTAGLRSGGQFAPGVDPNWAAPPTEQVRVEAQPQTETPIAGTPENPTQPLPTIAPSTVRVQDAPGNGRNRISAEEVAQKCIPQRVSGVSKLDLGSLLRGPGELATKGDSIIATAREIADVVIVEAPSMIGATDAESLTRSVDAILVVAECYKTTVKTAKRTGELLRGVGAPALGVVLTEVPLSAKERRSLSPGVPTSR